MHTAQGVGDVDVRTKASTGNDDLHSRASGFLSRGLASEMHSRASGHSFMDMSRHSGAWWSPGCNDHEHPKEPVLTS